MYTMIIYSTNDQTAQRLIGTWENAITILRTGAPADMKDYARTYITNIIEQHTTESTEGLWDWVAEGDWGGRVDQHDPRSLAQEWDENQRRWKAEQASYAD